MDHNFSTLVFFLSRSRDTPLIGDRNENMVSTKFMGGKKKKKIFDPLREYTRRLKFKRKKSESREMFPRIIEFIETVCESLY